MLELTVTVSGKTQNDIELAVEEVKRLVDAGYTSGTNRNDSGEFFFNTTGEAEEVESDSEDLEEVEEL